MEYRWGMEGVWMGMDGYGWGVLVPALSITLFKSIARRFFGQCQRRLSASRPACLPAYLLLVVDELKDFSQVLSVMVIIIWSPSPSPLIVCSFTCLFVGFCCCCFKKNCCCCFLFVRLFAALVFCFVLF